MSKVRLYGDTSGYVDLKAPDVANDVTITLPNETGPFATETYVDTEIAAIPEIAGIGSNVQVIEGSGGFSTSSGSYTQDTQIGTLSFTPTSASSKVLLIYSLSRGYILSGGQAFYARIYADGSAIGDELILTSSGAGDNLGGALVTLHAPATTSAVAYTVRVRTSSGTAQYLKRQLTAIEVAA